MRMTTWTPTACTIIFRNYLSHAKILARSFARHVPGGKFYVLVVDGLPRGVKVGPHMHILTPADLKLPHFYEMCFKYDVTELSTAMKPTLMAHLLQKSRQVIYFDPDILLMRPLDELRDAMATGNIILTPHMIAPMPQDNHKPSEQDILMSGAYNLGFLALNRSADAAALLVWWEERLRDGCRIDRAKGLFTDQKWMDLVPSMFASTVILRDQCYNVAYWNLHARHITKRAGRYLVNGRPLAFYHFSGFNPAKPEVFSKHQTRTVVHKGSALAELLAGYVDLQMKNGYRTCSAWPSGYTTFSNGIPVHALLRQTYLQLEEPIRRRFGDPFEVEARRSFFRWATRVTDEKLSPFLESLLRVRFDVAGKFPDVNGKDREKFLRWASTSGAKEMGYDPRLVPKVEVSAPATTPPQTRAKPTPPPMIGVNVSGYFASEKGVGEAVRSDVRGLKAAGIQYLLNNFTDTGSHNQNTDYRKFAEDNPFPVNLVHVNADQIPHFVRHKGDRYFAGHYNIAYWAWELAQFPKEWRENFQRFDEIWVPSRFTLDSVSRVAPIPVIRMPHCLPAKLPIRPWSRAHFKLPAKPFLFLFIFDCHSFLERKNPLGLIRAFRHAFPRGDDALLVLKCSHATAEQLTLLREAAGKSNVRIMDEVMDRATLVTLMSLADCYVSLHRSEGFGLTLAESMALEKPVISTAYSGNLDFMTPSNSFLVKYNLVEIEQDHGPYKKGFVWADPDLNHAAELMRYVFENRRAGQAIGRAARQDVARELSPRTVGALVAQRLSQIRPRPKPPAAPTISVDYERLRARVREVVHSAVPAGATVIVTSKGDDQLLRFEGRQGWHFPQTGDGTYAGYYPADSAAALAHLNALRAKGGRYVLFPKTSFWWLTHYAEFGEHLAKNCRTVARLDDTCVIYELANP